MLDALEEMLLKVIDRAVSEGRSNWDSYYGHDNTYHIQTIRETSEYKMFLERIEELYHDR